MTNVSPRLRGHCALSASWIQLKKEQTYILIVPTLRMGFTGQDCLKADEPVGINTHQADFTHN